MGAFNSSAIWNSTRIWEPTFGPLPTGSALNADWGMVAPTQTPRDICVWSETEAYVPWAYPHFLGEQNANFLEDTHAFTMPQSAYTGWRVSCDVRFSAQTIPPRAEGNAASNYLAVRSSTGTFLDYCLITQTLHFAGDTWQFLSSAGTTLTLPSLTKNRYYRIGLRKYGTTLSAWMNPNPDTGAVPTPWGAAGDEGLVKLLEKTILPTYATAPYLGFYSSSNYVGFDPPSGAYDRGGIAKPRVEELSLSMGSPVPGLPTEPINLPPGAPGGSTTGGGSGGGSSANPGGWGAPDYPAWAGPGLSMRKLAETAGYHRYKALRTAMNIYNNLRLDR